MKEFERRIVENGIRQFHIFKIFFSLLTFFLEKKVTKNSRTNDGSAHLSRPTHKKHSFFLVTHWSSEGRSFHYVLFNIPGGAVFRPGVVKTIYSGLRNKALELRNSFKQDFPGRLYPLLCQQIFLMQ